MTKEIAKKIVRGITDKIECNTVDIDDWAEFWGFTREEYEEFLDMAIKALESQRWIPISERLPNEFVDVLCNTDSEEIFIATYLGKMNDGTNCFDDNDGMMWEGDVIAWMPLPEPYKVEREDE